MSRRILIRGTRGSGPPQDLAFRELAYSDEDQAIYVGRPDGAGPPIKLEPPDPFLYRFSY